MSNDIFNERKAKYMTYDQRILCDKVFRDQECSEVKLALTEAVRDENWDRVCKCSDYLKKYADKTNDELEIDEVVESVTLTNEENTKNDSNYLSDNDVILEESDVSDTVDDEPIIVNRTM